MVTRALILAAGKGIAAGDHPGPNSLTTVGGETLIERTLTVLAAVGIRQVAITTGWRGDELRRAIADSARVPAAIKRGITYFENLEWEKPNGLSVQAARPFLTERTLLVMADQIAAPALLHELVELPATADRTVLCIDRDLARVFDIEDATKVQIRGRRRARHRQGLDPVPGGQRRAVRHVTYPAGRAGQPGRAVVDPGGAAAAARGLVTAYDVGAKLWQDVDAPAMKAHADWLVRVYGAELARPSVTAEAHSHAGDTMALIDRLLAEKDLPGHVLFSPGPVMTSARVKAALVHHDVCHRDEDYSAVVGRLQAKLRPVFGASPEHEMLLLTGSGTAAMEMAISSVIPAGKKILVVSNGAFGDRLDEIAALHGIGRVVLRYPWGELPDAAAVGRALAGDPDIAGAALIHHETSVGLLNPVREIGRLCRARGVDPDRRRGLRAGRRGRRRRAGSRRHLLLVGQQVPAFGVGRVVPVCRAGGLGARRRHPAAGLLPGPEAPPRYLEELRQTPFTPAVSSFFALETALDELAEQRRRAGAPRHLSQARAAHPPGLHRSRVRVVHQHRP